MDNKMDNQEEIRLRLVRPDTSTRTELPVATSGVSAGFPSPADDHLDPPLDLNRELVRNPGATFFARVAGDSMQADGIADGDLLLTIFRHKYMELSAENYEEWYDMVRYYRLAGTDFTATGLGYTQSMQHLVLPIPTQALSGNSLLVQNPTYEISNH